MSGPDRSGAILLVILIAAATVVAVILHSTSVPPATGAGTGTLTGNVTIGPLCPVEPCTISEDQRAAAYAARTILVFTPDRVQVARAVPDPLTGYSIALSPGAYIVDIPRQGIGGSAQLPKTIVIHAGETIRLDIAIDTGIR